MFARLFVKLWDWHTMLSEFKLRLYQNVCKYWSSLCLSDDETPTPQWLATRFFNLKSALVVYASILIWSVIFYQRRSRTSSNCVHNFNVFSPGDENDSVNLQITYLWLRRFSYSEHAEAAQKFVKINIHENGFYKQEREQE